MSLNVLITGANSGFGLLTASAFASAGHMVYAGYRNPEKRGSLEALKEEGLSVKPVRIDVTDSHSIAEGVSAATADAPLDILINNAGFEVRCPIDELSDEMVKRQFDTNVTGVIRMVRAVSPAMRRRRSGVIVNISSVVGYLAFPYTGIYSASKHAVEAISEAMFLELAPFGVRVAVVAPGAFETSFGENVITDTTFTEGSEHWDNAQRFASAFRAITGRSRQSPQEVAAIVLQAATEANPRFRYLAGSDAKMIVPLYRSQEFEGFLTGMLGALGIPDWAGTRSADLPHTTPTGS